MKTEMEELPKRISSNKHVICVDKIDCCLGCIKRRRKPKRNPKNKKKVKHARK